MSSEVGEADPSAAWVQAQARAENLRLSLHAQAEMAEEGIRLDDTLEALEHCQVVESYPEHRRGPCALVYGRTRSGRPLHVVCTIAGECLIIITVYEPRPPSGKVCGFSSEWLSPTSRSAR